MHRLIWLSSFLILTAALGQIFSESQVGVCPVEAKQQSPAQQNGNNFYGISEDKPPSQENAQVVIINRNKPKHEEDTKTAEAESQRAIANPTQEKAQVVIINRNKSKNEEDTKTAEAESQRTISNPRRSPTQPISFNVSEMPNNPDHASYYDEPEPPYEVPYTTPYYEECQPKSRLTKKLILPAVVAGGLAGIGVRTAMKEEECQNTLKLNAVEDLTFDFKLDYVISEQGAYIDFNVVLPDGSIYDSLSLDLPGQTATVGPIPNIYPGQIITIVATDFANLSTGVATFTMTGLIKGVAFDTQTFNYTTTPTPPQSFTFTIPYQ